MRLKTYNSRIVRSQRDKRFNYYVFPLLFHDFFKVPLVNYWSEKEATCYGSLTVETTAVDSNSNYIVRSITLTETRVSDRPLSTNYSAT